MKITPFIHKYAPELCYFEVNGCRFQEKPMLGKQVDWYEHLFTDRGKNIITAIREKHFKKGQFVRVATIVVEYPSGFEYLNKKYIGCISSYSQLLESMKTKLPKKHNINGGLTYEKYDVDSNTFNTELMPLAKITVKTKLVCR